jgi:micrococcal nuclease
LADECFLTWLLQLVQLVQVLLHFVLQFEKLQTQCHRHRKMKEDEQKSHLPAQLLLQFGLKALHFVLSVAPPKTTVTIITEQNNFYDFWNRQLGYVILPDGNCLNELLLMKGYAKATHQYYCSKLKEYQVLNRQAQMKKAGIYSVVKVF